jgi:hypothetical protein
MDPVGRQLPAGLDGLRHHHARRDQRHDVRAGLVPGLRRAVDQAIPTPQNLGAQRLLAQSVEGRLEERLVDLYDETGKSDEAAKWREELESWQAAEKNSTIPPLKGDKQ